MSELNDGFVVEGPAPKHIRDRELISITRAQYDVLRAENAKLRDALRNLLSADFAEQCQECGIGHQDCWAEAKAILAKTGIVDPPPYDTLE